MHGRLCRPFWPYILLLKRYSVVATYVDPFEPEQHGTYLTIDVYDDSQMRRWKPGIVTHHARFSSTSIAASQSHIQVGGGVFVIKEIQWPQGPIRNLLASYPGLVTVPRTVALLCDTSA
jgi:hypothetical protein